METRRVWCHRSSKEESFKKEQVATGISCCQVIRHVDKSSFSYQMGAETRLEGFGSKRISSASYETQWMVSMQMIPPSLHLTILRGDWRG